MLWTGVILRIQLKGEKFPRCASRKRPDIVDPAFGRGTLRDMFEARTAIELPPFSDAGRQRIGR